MNDLVRPLANLLLSLQVHLLSLKSVRWRSLMLAFDRCTLCLGKQRLAVFRLLFPK